MHYVILLARYCTYLTTDIHFTLWIMATNNTLFDADKANMYNVLLTFPEQVRHAVDIGEQAVFFNNKPKGNNLVVLGLGGSAIGGDLVRSYCASTKGADSLAISVSRGYTVPGTVDSNTAVIASSYSGDTEETLSAYESARKQTKNILCISTGGKLSVKAKKHGLPVITIPGGFQPRCALGYSFFPLLYTVMRHPLFDKKAVKVTEKAVQETIQLLEKLSESYAEPNVKKNPALKLAQQLHGTAPVIYSSHERMDTVNIRWRGQIQENAKNVAFGNLLPEMNHNEINGWGYPNFTKQFSVVLLRDKDDHARVAIRFDALKSIIKPSVHSITELYGKGDSLLARMFSQIYLGDWVSYYMAMLNNVDPSPVPVISKLKAVLAKK